ncbi:MAG: hypothetical protein HY647_00440, partial [Acidobacteria bacterium]|nr:hypothetical protein [Acidobacteriota bacterium]
MPTKRASTPEKASAKDSPAKVQTSSGIEVKPFYTPQDLDDFSGGRGFSEERDLGRPGEYPFTRGVYPSMYRGRLWT